MTDPPSRVSQQQRRRLTGDGRDRPNPAIGARLPDRKDQNAAPATAGPASHAVVVMLALIRNANRARGATARSLTRQRRSRSCTTEAGGPSNPASRSRASPFSVLLAHQELRPCPRDSGTAQARHRDERLRLRPRPYPTRSMGPAITVCPRGRGIGAPDTHGTYAVSTIPLVLSFFVTRLVGGLLEIGGGQLDRGRGKGDPVNEPGPVWNMRSALPPQPHLQHVERANGNGGPQDDVPPGQQADHVLALRNARLFRPPDRRHRDQQHQDAAHR